MLRSSSVSADALSHGSPIRFVPLMYICHGRPKYVTLYRLAAFILLALDASEMNKLFSHQDAVLSQDFSFGGFTHARVLHQWKYIKNIQKLRSNRLSIHVGHPKVNPHDSSGCSKTQLRGPDMCANTEFQHGWRFPHCSPSLTYCHQKEPATCPNAATVCQKIGGQNWTRGF